MERYRDGAADAFDSLYRRHCGGVYRYLLRQCGQREASDELFQDVWLNVVKARSSYVPTARFATWLYRIAHNRLIDHYRAQSGGVPVSFDESPEALELVPAARTADPAVLAESKQQAHRLLDWLGELPPAQREAFLMQQEAGLSVAAIATATGVSIETAKSRLRYAIARLRAANRAEGISAEAVRAEAVRADAAHADADRTDADHAAAVGVKSVTCTLASTVASAANPIANRTANRP